MAERGGERIGQQFGNYHLTRFLGQGGFADVYQGEHTFLRTQAAIKILRAQLTQDEQEGFLREARIIAHLVHPNIIRVLDFGMQGDLPFLVMDYAPNGSLREHHSRGTRLALETVITYVKQLASALQYAHDEKLIHRDVKPENMLVGRNGEILLGDFGISVVAQSTHSQRTQEVVGSVPYMAPEQLQGRPRPSSDQYALGVVVYEWLCGDRPFQGSFTEIYGQHLLAPPPPLRTKNPTLSPDVEAVVMTALAKDPHQRFGTIRAFATALEQAASQPRMFAAATPPPPPLAPTVPAQPALAASPLQTMAPQPSPHAPTEQVITEAPVPVPQAATARPHISRRVVLAGLGAGALAVAGGVTWYVIAHHYPPQGTLIYTYALHNDIINSIAWNGERIVSGSQDDTVQVWDATTGNNVHIYRNNDQTINGVAWSPDGSRVAFASDDGTVQIWNLSASRPSITYPGHKHGSSGRALTVAWSPDGQYIASGGDDGTAQVWHASSGAHIYTYPGHSNNSTSVNSVAWSPDGTRIASGADDDTVQVWDALTGKHAYPYKGHLNTVYSVAWSPDGTRIASAGADKSVQVWNPSAPGQQIVYTKHTDSVNSVAWSSDSQHIASASADKTVQVWNPATSGSAYIYKHHTASVNTVVWGDSHRVASAGEDKTVQVWEGV